MTDPPHNRTVVAFSLALALIAILGLYYWVHKPVQPAQAARLLSVFADLAVVVLLTLLGGGVGRRVLHWSVLSSAIRHLERSRKAQSKAESSTFREPTGEGPKMGVSPGERVTIEVALGWGLMGLVMLALGVAQLYYSMVAWPLVLIALFTFWRDVRGWLADFASSLRGLLFPDRLSRLAVGFVLFTLTLGLMRALAPPLMWDALVYHLTLPKLYAQTHGLRLESNFFFSGMPQLTEMLYTFAVLLRGETAAQTLGWAFGALLSFGLAAFGAQALLGVRTSDFAALAPAILFSSFTLALSLAWAYADLLLMLLALAVLIALRYWKLEENSGLSSGLSQTYRKRWLRLAAVLAGLAAGCKYTGVLIPLAGAIVVSWQSAVVSVVPFGELRGSASSQRSAEINGAQWLFDFRLHSSQAVLRPLSFVLRLLSFVLRPLSFVLLSFVLFSPWLIKNLAFTGSPTYPLLFPARDVDALRLQFYNRPDLTERNPVWAALIFFRAVFAGVQGGNDYDATLGPLFVLLLLGLAVGWRSLETQVRDALKPVALFALVSYVGWVALTFVSDYAVQARLFFSIFPALALLCAGGAAALAAGFDTATVRVSVILKAALILVLGLSALEQWIAFSAQHPLAYLTGAQSAQDYRAANLGWYAVAMERVNALPVGSRVKFLWEPRSLDCSAPDRCDPDLIIDRWWHLRRTGNTPVDAIAGWKAEGFTHVLIYEAGVKFIQEQRDNRFAPADWTELETLRAQIRLVENIGGAYSLYALP